MASDTEIDPDRNALQPGVRVSVEDAIAIRRRGGAVRGMTVAKGRGKTRRKSEARRRGKSEFPLHQTAQLDRISLATWLSYTRVVFSEGLERQEKGYFHKPFTNFFL